MKSISDYLSNLTYQLFGQSWNYKLRYLHNRGHLPNFKHPKDMSEILLSQMTDPTQAICKRYTSYIDKIGVRDYVQSKGLGQILLQHYGIWNNPEDIPFDSLPDKFVLKSNNGCGNHVICHDKSKLNKAAAISTLHKAIEDGKHSLEPQYRYITPRVYAEELIDTGDGSLPIDYKFTCIGGEIVDVFVAVDRETNTKYCTMDTNWQQLPYIKKSYCPDHTPPRPKCLEEMISVAKTLSKDFDFVRVDLYEYRDKPYISELTFFPWGGMLYGYTNEAIKNYGEKWHELQRTRSKGIG